MHKQQKTKMARKIQIQAQSVQDRPSLKNHVTTTESRGKHRLRPRDKLLISLVLTTLMFSLKTSWRLTSPFNPYTSDFAYFGYNYYGASNGINISTTTIPEGSGAIRSRRITTTDRNSNMESNNHNYTNTIVTAIDDKNRSNDTFNDMIVTSNTTSTNITTNTTKGYKLCFVSSVFATDALNADKLSNATKLRIANPDFHFILFTNLHEIQAPGWHKVVLKDLKHKLNIHRTITQSRWPKFLPWKHKETLGSCPIIFYIDGFTIPKNKEWVSDRFRKAAKKIKEHAFGLAQYNKPNSNLSIEAMGKQIIRYQKDTKSNIRKTMKWLRSQEDYRKRKGKQRVYFNRYIGIDPHNKNYQNMSQYFWDVYSKESGTFRDQLLWAYVVDKFKAKPLNMNKAADIWKKIFDVHDKNQGYNGHKYVNKAGKLLVEEAKDMKTKTKKKQ